MMPSVWTQALELLQRQYGRQAAPGGESLLERTVAVILQPRGGSAATKTIDRLRASAALDVDTLAQLSVDELAGLLPNSNAAGAARRLRDVMRLVAERGDGLLESLFALSPDALRSRLQMVQGLGPETIDKLLLAAGGVATLPISTAVHRVAKRHGWVEMEADSRTISVEIAAGLPSSADDCWQLHVLLERVGKDYCRASPLCGECPLQTLLPEGGAREPE